MHMIVSAIVGTVLFASPLLAQGTVGYVIPNARVPRDPLPRFTIAPRGGLPAPIGLPLPQIGLQPPELVNEPFDGRRGRVFHPWPMMVFYVPQPIAAAAPPPVLEPRPYLAPPMPGRLVL